ncbi:MAG: hypothetical protein LBT53_02840 [Puniceicoccales bacterium]|jgi:hypothetical protein|nr:hypothetical protein [Puniceicoccales bacterium]
MKKTNLTKQLLAAAAILAITPEMFADGSADNNTTRTTSVQASATASVSRTRTVVVTAGDAEAKPEKPIDLDEENKLATPEISTSKVDLTLPADAQVTKLISNYLEKNKELSANGRITFNASETVAAKITSPQWGKALSNAYQKAFANVQAQFFKSICGRNLVEVTRKAFDENEDTQVTEDPAENAKEKTPTEVIATASAKIGNLQSDAELDKVLAKAGVDTAQFAGKTLEQKKVLARDEFVRTSVVKALGEIAGVTVAQSFVARDDQGNYQVGCIGLWSPKTLEIANAIREKRLPNFTGKPKKSFLDSIPKNEETLASTIGLRTGFDENGKPILLSYGLWSSSYTGNIERQAMRARGRATEQARMIADGDITLFQQSQLDVDDKSTISEIVETLKTDNGTTETAKFSDILSRNTKQTGSADMQGRGDVKPWMWKTPEGHWLVGVVRVWSPSGLVAAQKVKAALQASKEKAATGSKAPVAAARPSATTTRPATTARPAAPTRPVQTLRPREDIKVQDAGNNEGAGQELDGI